MCNKVCIDFGTANLKEGDIRGKSVIEVGAMDINGSLRSFMESFGPRKYIGVDIHMGPGVDMICKIEDLKSTFGPDSFDLVVCTEVLEHVEDWWEAIHNLKQIVNPGGALLITTRSRGFLFHGFPFDFWRYEVSDMENIFSDFEIKDLRSDSKEPGVLFFARKPSKFSENNVKKYKLYSILFNRRLPIVKNKIFRSAVFLLLRYKMVLQFIWDSALVRQSVEYSKRKCPKLVQALKIILKFPGSS